MRKEVLIVEPDRRTADTLVLRLTARGYGVASAASLSEAEQVLEGRNPELVILGLGLPGADRLVKRVRQGANGATVPVLLLGTGSEAVSSQVEAVAVGADDFFRKPGELDLLVEKVAVVLGPPNGSDDGAPDETVDFSSLNTLAWTEPPRRASPPMSRPRTPAADSADFSSIDADLQEISDAPRAMPPPDRSLVAPTPLPQPVLPPLPRLVLRSAPPRLGSPPTVRPLHPDTPPPAARPPMAEPAAEAASAPASSALGPAAPTPLASERPLPVEARPAPSAPPGQPAAAQPLADARLDPTTRFHSTSRMVSGAPSASPGVYSLPPAPAAVPEPWPEPAPLPEDRPGRGFAAPQAPMTEEEAEWRARLQPGRALPLGERPLAVAVAAAWRLGLTGRLEVASGGVLRRIFLDAGRPVFFDSSDAEEDLAGTLVAEGLVTRSAAARARTRARTVGAPTDEVLIEQGFVAPDAAWRALRTHVIEHIVALFGLEAGEALVVQGGPRPPDPVDLGLTPGRLILDGIRRRYGRLRLYQAFGTPVVVPRLRRIPGDGLVLRADEDAVLRACDGRRTAAEIARGLRLGEVDVLAMLHGLALLGCLEGPLASGGGLPALPGELIARAGAPQTADDMPGYADLVARKLADAQTADYFTLLEIPRGATGAELEAAWENLRRRFDPHRLRPEGALFGAVQEIAAVLGDAHAMLSDARRRARYEAALGDG